MSPDSDVFSEALGLNGTALYGTALSGAQAQGPSVLPRKLCPFTPKPGANGALKRLLAYGPQDDEFLQWVKTDFQNGLLPMSRL